jgi:hypothetical protein
MLRDESVTFTFRGYGLCRDANTGLVATGYSPFSVALIEAMTDEFNIRAQPDGTIISLACRVSLTTQEHRDTASTPYRPVRSSRLTAPLSRLGD